LATEAEWEHAACQTLPDAYGVDHAGNWSDEAIDCGRTICPQVESHPSDATLGGLMGNTWQWTSSHYSPYPGYTPPAGALGEYNGKFMCNVFVLRGGSCATPSKHVRASYRNFFAPDTRWQFSGIRLARS
jgi:formylglycine-generating enzyme required for sulfatase activity